MTEVRDNNSGIGWRYGAVLEWDERVPKLRRNRDSSGWEDAGNARQTHRMEVSGKVHPEPYDHPSAVVLVQRKLQPLVDLGWRIEEMIVKANR